MSRIILFLVMASLLSIQPVDSATLQQTPRTIVSDDFVNKRPRRKRAKPNRRRTYRLASIPLTNPPTNSSFETLQVGVTIWKLQRARAAHSNGQSMSEDLLGQSQLVARRVEADTQFREGDLLRLTIESPRVGYLYVVDRDWFTDGSAGETNLIFPVRGEDNRLQPGTLIDIPPENETPFRTNPKPNQAGELLTIIVTSSPLPLPLTKNPLPISNAQLAEWEARWGSLAERFEMIGGAGQARTLEEQQAASSRSARQLTRDDPGPQTIYFVSPRHSDGLLFNLMLSYVR